MLSPDVKALAPLLYETAMGIGGITFPADPIEDEPDYASALAAFERLPSVRILFDNGAGSSTRRAPVDAFEQWVSTSTPARTCAPSRVPASRAPCRNLRGRPARSTCSRLAAPGSAPPTSPATPYWWAVGRLAGLSLDPESGGHRAAAMTAPLTQNTVLVGAAVLGCAWIEGDGSRTSISR